VDELRPYILENWFELASLVLVCVVVPLVLLWTAILIKIERHLRVVRDELEIRVWSSRDERDEHLIPR
jgi:hypothetical protein